MKLLLTTAQDTADAAQLVYSAVHQRPLSTNIGSYLAQKTSKPIDTI